MEKLKLWWSTNVDTKTMVSSGFGVGLFGLGMFALKSFGGKAGKKAADTMEGKK
ncbi:MAG: hypothetical protein ACRBBW_21325 [Cellvibrionaceae bacterium]